MAQLYQLPPFHASQNAWRKVVPLLVKAGRQVYVLEPRGFGDSDKPQGGYDLDTAARDLHGFLAATGLGRPGVATVLACAPRRVVLVSCDAASLGRDARLLVDAGFALRRAELEAVYPGLLDSVLRAAMPSMRRWQAG